MYTSSIVYILSTSYIYLGYILYTMCRYISSAATCDIDPFLRHTNMQGRFVYKCQHVTLHTLTPRVAHTVHSSTNTSIPRNIYNINIYKYIYIYIICRPKSEQNWSHPEKNTGSRFFRTVPYLSPIWGQKNAAGKWSGMTFFKGSKWCECKGYTPPTKHHVPSSLDKKKKNENHAFFNPQSCAQL